MSKLEFTLSNPDQCNRQQKFHHRQQLSVFARTCAAPRYDNGVLIYGKLLGRKDQNHETDVSHSKHVLFCLIQGTITNFILDTFTKKPVIFTLHELKVTFYNQEVMDTQDHNTEQELLSPGDK